MLAALSLCPTSSGLASRSPIMGSGLLFSLQQKQGHSLRGSCTVLRVILTDPNLGDMLVSEPVTMPRGWNSLMGQDYSFP